MGIVSNKRLANGSNESAVPNQNNVWYSSSGLALTPLLPSCICHLRASAENAGFFFPFPSFKITSDWGFAAGVPLAPVTVLFCAEKGPR